MKSRRYPVHVFHTNHSTSDELSWLSEAAPPEMQVVMEEVTLGFPSWIDNHVDGLDDFFAPPRCMLQGQHYWTSHKSCGCRCPSWRARCWPLNWLHATRFFTAGMFRTAAFQSGQYEYFMRLDTDFFFVNMPPVDPVVLMQRQGCTFAYDKLSREAPGCHDGFEERVGEFV